MLHKKLIIVMLLSGGAVLFLAGCYKDKTVLIQQEITTPVSFKNDIIPIFNRSCNMAGCHRTGGQVPDLLPDNALRTLNEEDLISVDDPENSELLGWLTGKIKPAMPLGAATNPSNLNALVLAWIKQGAKDN